MCLLTCSVAGHADARKQLWSASLISNTEASRNVLVHEKKKVYMVFNTMYGEERTITLKLWIWSWWAVLGELEDCEGTAKVC